METQASLVVPKDHGEIEMFVSTQNAHKTQVSKVWHGAINSSISFITSLVVSCKSIGSSSKQSADTCEATW